MRRLPLLLRDQGYSATLPRRSLDFQARMSDIFGDALLHTTSSAPHLLMLTRTDDPEAGAVGLKLAANGISYLRMDADTLPEDTKFSLRDDSGEVTPLLSSPGAQELSDLRVVWLRNFDTTAIASPCENPIAEAFVRSEWQKATRSLLSIKSVRWINHPDTAGTLDRITQLRLARAAGFTTPKTLVSNDIELIRSFVKSCSSKAIVKVLGGHFVEPTPGTLHGVFPRVVTASDDDALEASSLVPAIYQEFVPHTTEIRATAIGQGIVAAEVLKTDPEDIWGRPDSISVRDYALPEQIEKKLETFMTLAGLEYGAFDLLVTPDGRYIFLEVNTSGDWRWLESRNVGLGITDKFAAHLAGLVDDGGHCYGR